MKTIHKKIQPEIAKEKRLIFYFGEDVHKAEIAKKGEEKKIEGEKKKAEEEENKPEKVIKLKTRYTGERSTELVKCDLLKKSAATDPNEKELAANKEKKIKDETVEPDKLEGKFLNAKEINDNMRKLYAILGKDWDQIKAAEEQKEKEEQAKPKEPEAKPKEPGVSPDAQPGSPEKPNIIKFTSTQDIFHESIDGNLDDNAKQALDAVMKEIHLKTVGKEFKNVDEVKTAIQIAINNMDGKYLSALAGKTMRLKAGEYNISFKFVKPGESPNQKAGIESVTMEKEAKPKAPEAKPVVPEGPKEELKRIKFSTLQRIKSSVDKNPDAKTTEAVTAVMKVIELKTQGIEFKTSEDLIKVIKYSINTLNAKYLAVLAGKDIQIKAGEYNIGFRFVKPGESPTQPLGIETASVEKYKPPEIPKPPEDKSKPAEDKGKPVESKEVTELRGKITTQVKALFEDVSKMSKEDLIKNHYDNGDKFTYELSRRFNNVAISLSSDLSKLGEGNYILDSVYPNTYNINFNKNGLFIGTMGQFVDNLYKEKGITDVAKKETPNAYEYVTQFHNKTNEVRLRFEDKAYVTQLGITSYEDYAKKFEAEVNVAVATIDKKYTQKIEWPKLDGNTLSSPLFKLVHFTLEKDKPVKVTINEAGTRSQWEKVKPQKPAEEKPKDQPKTPVEEKPDPAKFNKIRPTQEAAINRALSLSYEGSMYNDPIGIATAVKLQLQKLPIQEQYLIPTQYMTPQGIKLQMLYYGPKMEVKIVGVTETVAQKYVEKWEKAPRATAEVNGKKWAKIPCVDVYGNPKPKPEGWLKTKEGARLQKEADEAKAKKETESKPKESGVAKPVEKPAEQESPEVKEARNKVDAGMKKIFDNVSKMSKEELSAKGVFNILHEMSLATKVLEKDLAPDLAKLDKTYTSDKLQPPILIYFNKGGICMEKPGQWVSEQMAAKKAIDTVADKSPNAFKYTQLFTSKMVELRDKYNTKKALTDNGMNSPEEMSKKFNQELQTLMEKEGVKMTDKIEWANLPGGALVYPTYSYASFRLEKGKKISVSVNEAGIRTLWDKANGPKPGFEATAPEEKAKDDAPEKVEKAKTIVDEETKAIFKKYNDYTPEKLVSENLNNRTVLLNSIMNDIKASDIKLRGVPELSELNKTYQTESVPKVFVMFNKYGIRPGGLNDWMKNFYKDKKIQDVESKETPNARKAEEKIIDTLSKLHEKNGKNMDKETLQKQGINNFPLYYKFATDAAKKELDALGADLFANIEWDKLPNKTFKSPYTFYAEVKREQNSKESQYTFNYTMYKHAWDNMPDKPKPPEEVKKPPGKPQPIKGTEAPIGPPGSKRIPGKMYDKAPTQAPKDAPVGQQQYNDDKSSRWVSDGKKWTKVADDYRP